VPPYDLLAGQVAIVAGGRQRIRRGAAVENLTPVLSIEWARFGVRLTALAAGAFDTDRLRTKSPKPVVEGVAGTVSLVRLGTEEEFAWLEAFLPSPAGGRPKP
jgi:citronellol/citronellal dehydrogenase